MCCRMTAFDQENLHIIFTNLLTWWLHKFNYTQNISKLGKSMVAATLEVYDQVQKQLLPTPTKSHYTFNLRDVSKVFQVGHTAALVASQLHCSSHHLEAAQGHYTFSKGLQQTRSSRQTEQFATCGAACRA